MYFDRVANNASSPCTGVEEKILKKYINSTPFTLKLPSLEIGGHEIYNFLSSYHTDATYQRARATNSKFSPVDLAKNENDSEGRKKLHFSYWFDVWCYDVIF